MSDTSLRDEKLHKYADLFKEFSKTEEHRLEVKDREGRVRYFYETLTKERLARMTELDFGEFVTRLWAAKAWTNKEYLVRKLIRDNDGLERIKKNLLDLLHGDDPFQKRYDRFLQDVSGFGTGYVTEILCHFNPSEFGIWNSKARDALGILGYEKLLPLSKYRISAKEYIGFNKVEKDLAHSLGDLGIEMPNLLMLDYFLWRVWNWREKASGTEGIGPPTDSLGFDHDEIRDFIGEIGDFLGFETETEKIVQHGAKVDVIWRAKIANLGVVMYVFEVHKSGSIDSLIMNLQKAKKNPSVQKLIAVSDIRQLEQIRKEIKGLPGDFVEALSFWDAMDVKITHDKLAEVVNSIDKLQLVKSEFEVG